LHCTLGIFLPLEIYDRKSSIANCSHLLDWHETTLDLAEFFNDRGDEFFLHDAIWNFSQSDTLWIWDLLFFLLLLGILLCKKSFHVEGSLLRARDIG